MDRRRSSAIADTMAVNFSASLSPAPVCPEQYLQRAIAKAKRCQRCLRTHEWSQRSDREASTLSAGALSGPAIGSCTCPDGKPFRTMLSITVLSRGAGRDQFCSLCEGSRRRALALNA